MSFNFASLESIKGSEFDTAKSEKVDPRERFISNVKAQLALFNGEDSKMKPTFKKSEKTGRVGFSVKFGNSAINLNGSERAAYVVDAKEFAALLGDIIAAAEAGQFDDQLSEAAAKMDVALSKARKKVSKVAA